MRRLKVMNLAAYLKDYQRTLLTANHFIPLTDFNVEEKMPQRKQVLLGKILSRIVASDYVAALGHKGFRQDLVNDSMDMIKQEVSALVSSCHYSNHVVPVQDYNINSSWMDFS